MVGFKLRVPPVDVFRAMAEMPGARKRTPIAFPELYLALSQGAVDGQENPLPTIQSGKFFEVQKHPRAHRAYHHAAHDHRERGVLEGPAGGGSRHSRSRPLSTPAQPGRTRNCWPRRRRHWLRTLKAAGMNVDRGRYRGVAQARARHRAGQTFRGKAGARAPSTSLAKALSVREMAPRLLAILRFLQIRRHRGWDHGDAILRDYSLDAAGPRFRRRAS